MKKLVLSDTVKAHAKTAGSGVVIGASMLLPGISGGTMAIILGVYDRLISAVSGIFKNFKRNIVFLLVFGAGALLGIALLSKVILSLVDRLRTPMMYLFIGAVIGSIPILFKKSQVKRLSGGNVICALIGLLLAVSVSFIPSGLLSPQPASLSQYALLVGAGFVLSIALVLPGISASYMLLILGLYEPALRAVDDRQILFLGALVLGLGLGTLCVTRGLERAMQKFPQQTYLLIIGFVVAAIKDVFPGLPNRGEIFLSIILLLMGTLSVHYISTRFSAD